MELSSYWELANPWPCNTPTASLFVTCWMLFESETIGEDLLLTSSFSEHLIVDLPRLNLPWVCSHCDLEYWHTNMHRNTIEDTLFLPDRHRLHKLVWNYILHRQAHLNLDNMQLLTSVTVKTFSKQLQQDVHIFSGILFSHLMCMRPLQRQTGEVEASLCIVPCIYSVIGAYPGVL